MNTIKVHLDLLHRLKVLQVSEECILKTVHMNKSTMDKLLTERCKATVE